MNQGVELGVLDIGLMVLTRMGSKSFRNEFGIIRVFKKECDRVSRYGYLEEIQEDQEKRR